MHKLLIVDDDQIIRAGMQQSIEWEDHGIRVIGTASNGRECLEMIPECLPDIILTDIKMPFMDGIQLTEAVYRLYPQIKVVLLTAYEDFKYAQMALNYKVCQYVMKYEHNSEVLKAVLKAAEEFDNQKNSGEMIRRSMELLKNNFFYDLVVNYKEGEQLKERADRLKLRFLSDRFCVVCVNAGQSAAGEGVVLLWKKKEMCRKVGEIFQKELTSGRILTHYFIGDHYLNLVVNFSEGSGREQERFFTALERLLVTTAADLKISLSAGAGSLYRGFENLVKSYTEALQALELKSMKHRPGEERVLVRFEEMKNSSVSHLEVLKQIMSFIDSNYEKEDLSLNRIASEVHLTPSYISFLFKKYRGVNLSDYLIDIRIRKAMELLTTTDFKTYEVSEKVGYGNPQYFSVVFKRIAGLSPMEYRKTHRA
jgi:two-component system response regulator YesN